MRLLKKLKAAALNDFGNVGVITNQSITFFPQDGFFADNGAFGNHTYEQQMHALTQVGATKPRPVLVNGGTADEWALQHGMSVSSEFTEVCHKLPKFHSKYSRDRFVAIVHTVYNASDMRRQVDACIDIGFGNLGVVGDYTEAIPPYWEEQVAYIAKKNEELAKANRELVLQQRHSLRTDDPAAAGEFVVPSGDSGWYKCAQTCSDPALCSPLSPQPKHRFEVVAPLVGGPRDLDAYGGASTDIFVPDFSERKWMAAQPTVQSGACGCPTKSLRARSRAFLRSTPSAAASRTTYSKAYCVKRTNKGSVCWTGTQWAASGATSIL